MSGQGKYKYNHANTNAETNTDTKTYTNRNTKYKLQGQCKADMQQGKVAPITAASSGGGLQCSRVWACSSNSGFP